MSNPREPVDPKNNLKSITRNSIPPEIWYEIIGYIGDEFPHMYFRWPYIIKLSKNFPKWTEGIRLIRSHTINKNLARVTIDWSQSAVIWMDVAVFNVHNAEELFTALDTASCYAVDRNIIICLYAGVYIDDFTVIGAVEIIGSVRAVCMGSFSFRYKIMESHYLPNLPVSDGKIVSLKSIVKIDSASENGKQENLNGIVMIDSLETEIGQQIHRPCRYGISNVSAHGILQVSGDYPSHWKLCTYNTLFEDWLKKKKYPTP